MSSDFGEGCFWVLVGFALIVGCLVFHEELLPPVTQFGVEWDYGIFWHDLLLTNKTGHDLWDVELELIFYTEDGASLERSKLWGKWSNGETKRISVPAYSYSKVNLRGNAEIREQEEVKQVKIRAGWIFYR